METRSIQADILIVGGGSAGCMAANRALEVDPSLSVVIFEKGDIKYSGSIARGMDALNIVAIPNFTTPDLFVESNTLHCGGVLDALPSYELASRSFGLLKKLEGWGVYFPQDAQGNYRTLQYHPKGKFLVAMQEPNLKVMLSSRVQEQGGRVVNRTMGLRLLRDGERVAGAVGINVRTGDLVVCHAKTVILANGGSARFGLPNSGSLYGVFDFPGNTGDGLVMGFLAGARLTGMEHTCRATLIKDVSMPLLAITITRGGRMLDIFDEILMEWRYDDHTKETQAVLEGRGPLRIRLSHLPAAVIEEIESILFTTERPVQKRFFQGRNIDFRKDDIELGPTEAQLCGGHGMSGLVVNERAETGVPGLYAAGDVACVAKGHLTGAFVFGEIAAEQGAAFVRSQPRPRFDAAQVEEVRGAIERRLAAGDKRIDVRDLEYKVRRLINDYVVSPKNAYKLGRWLDWAERFRHEMDYEVAVTNGHELSKLFEVEHIVRCATLSARAALERKESRWGDAHLRTDYPHQDNRNWLCHVDLRRGDDPWEVIPSTRALSRAASSGATA
jgi:succinate dehydrogenase/fumarate reductase flavoprotein subunit